MDVEALILSTKLALLTTGLLLVLGLPLASWLSTTRFRGRFLLEAVVALPIVLPPTVLGFYVLVAAVLNQYVLLGLFDEQPMPLIFITRSGSTPISNIASIMRSLIALCPQPAHKVDLPPRYSSTGSPI